MFCYLFNLHYSYHPFFAPKYEHNFELGPVTTAEQDTALTHSRKTNHPVFMNIQLLSTQAYHVFIVCKCSLLVFFDQTFIFSFQNSCSA